MVTLDIATNIVKTLVDKGYIAYFAGGWVRDFLLGHPSEDIDIATNATPEELTEIFPRTILVGARFGVVIIVEGGHQFEVATFRKEGGYDDGRRPTEVFFSSAKEDASRRDFTINGMFFDPLNKEVLDFVGGKDDLESKIIRSIGLAKERFTEDRLRMLRAIRFSNRFGFTIEEKTMQAMKNLAPSLFPSVSMERVAQELEKMASAPRFNEALLQLHEVGLLTLIFPLLSEVDDIEARICMLQLFPKEASMMLQIFPLFAHLQLKEWLLIGKRLKQSNEMLKQMEFLWQTKRLLDEEEISLWSYAHLYAHALSPLILRLLGASEEHHRRQHLLKADIERIKNKTPLITSQLLSHHLVPSGPQMGHLLLLGEQIAINERLHCPEEVLHRLKKSELWPLR